MRVKTSMASVSHGTCPSSSFDKEDIDLGVIDLYDLQRSGCRKFAGHGLCSLDALCVFALQSDGALIDAINARPGPISMYRSI
jgi:hypothetical protein